MTSTFKTPAWVEPREYQQEAVRAWFKHNGQGMYNMATGTGKTITSLLTAGQVAANFDQLFLVIAVPYQHLVDQWAGDVREFGVEPVLAYKSRRQWQGTLERQLAAYHAGARDAVVVIVTHATFASKPFQRLVARIPSRSAMLIADEAHHLGAPHLRSGLSERFKQRLALSATPERWYDEEGTEELMEYFSGVVYEYGLQAAIKNGALCPYYYIPHIVQLTADETEEYLTLTRTIGRLASRFNGNLSDADLQGNSSLQFALFKRARLVGTAENKLTRLNELIDQMDSVDHTLVYCGDGSIGNEETGKMKRHVDAAVDELRAKGLRVNRFTARETQADREKLLEEFRQGELEALVAIRCLDEGVDVPATRTAFMLASSSNPRQFVQRRGRILRTHPGKEFAVIHDFIAVPAGGGSLTGLEGDAFNAERSLIRSELERVSTFTEAAINHPDADVPGIPSGEGSLRELKRMYNLRHM
ncbi:DEAD/DEAH box helicase family protein [Haladaptatus sp. ZSTT2]|uniref:DEAD/DEAH box helicase family protein n=1 Tax=Haladaptatus sp. ZSTT2 TaxID=3120515 RepID=UPI00300F46E0